MSGLSREDGAGVENEGTESRALSQASQSSILLMARCGCGWEQMRRSLGVF